MPSVFGVLSLIDRLWYRLTHWRALGSGWIPLVISLLQIKDTTAAEISVTAILHRLVRRENEYLKNLWQENGKHLIINELFHYLDFNTIFNILCGLSRIHFHLYIFLNSISLASVVLCFVFIKRVSNVYVGAYCNLYHSYIPVSFYELTLTHLTEIMYVQIHVHII